MLIYFSAFSVYLLLPSNSTLPLPFFASTIQVPIVPKIINYTHVKFWNHFTLCFPYDLILPHPWKFTSRNLPSVFLTLNANIPLTFPTRLFPSFFRASSMPSNITDEVKPVGFELQWHKTKYNCDSKSNFQYKTQKSRLI